MNDKHTPGPWKIVTSWNDHLVVGPNDEEIIFQDGNYDTPTIKLSNARLIASAPDLLEALKWLMDDADDLRESDSFMNARKAISKAEGTI